MSDAVSTATDARHRADGAEVERANSRVRLLRKAERHVQRPGDLRDVVHVARLARDVQVRRLMADAQRPPQDALPSSP
jgi:hypothetical protein